MIANRVDDSMHHVAPDKHRRYLWMAWLICLMLASGITSVHHGVDGMWDTKNYHIYAPFAEFHHRYDFDVAPAQQPGFLNPFLDYPLYLYIRFLNGYPRVIAFLMGLPQGLNLWLIGLIAWRICKDRRNSVRVGFALVTTWIGATGAGTLPLVGTATGDLPVTTPILGALLMLIRAIDAWPDRRAFDRRLIACGLLLGLGLGAKPSVACYVVGLAIALVVATPMRAIPRAIVRVTASGIVGTVMTGGYHAFILSRLFGNPLFPLMNNIFHSPFWDSIAFRDTRFLPRSFWDVLTFPLAWSSGTQFGVTAELTFRDIRIALALLAIIGASMAAVLSRRALPKSTLIIFTFMIVSYVVWAFSFSIYRYALAMEMLSGVIILAALFELALSSAIPILMLMLAFTSWRTTVPLEWGHSPYRGHYVEVSAPPVDPSSLILIIGADPIAYLIPFMNTGARWLGLDNNLLHPDQDNGLIERERKIITDHTGPIYTLDAGAPPSRVSAVLAMYGLKENPDLCDRVSSNLGDEIYALCRVERDPG